MLRTAALLLLIGAMPGVAQAPQAGESQPAPPEVDRALRPRVAAFFQAHVDRKYRLADQYVAEDSKDHFFAADKPRYLSFEILSITYSDDFTRAKATVNCESEMLMPGFGKLKVKLPRVTLWKVVDGEWFWYVEGAGRETPFGTMAAGPPAGGAPPFAIPEGPGIEDIQKMVRADRTEVKLSARRTSSAEVVISNHMPGVVDLKLEIPPVPGLTVELDRSRLMHNESARVSLRHEPKGKSRQPPVRVVVLVEPINTPIPITVTFVSEPDPN